MKKIIYLFTVCCLISCSSDSSSSSSSEPSIVGKWEIMQVRSFPEGTIITGNETLFDHPHECSTKKDYMQFYSGGTTKQVTYSSTCLEDASLGTFNKTDILLNLTSQDGSEHATWEIITLNNTDLKVKYPNPSTGTPVEIIVLSYKKV